MQAIIFGIGLFGSLAMQFYAQWVVTFGPDGWRYIFIEGALGFVALILGIFWMKETPRWYVKKGMFQKAAEVIAQFNKEANPSMSDREAEQIVKTLSEELAQLPKFVGDTKNRLAELFAPGQLKRTLMICGVWFFATTGFWAFLAWIPTLLYHTGFPLREAVLFSAVMGIGAPLGALAAAPYIDRFGRRKLMIFGQIFCIVLFILYGFSRAPWSIMVVGFVLMFFMQLCVSCIYAYTPELFPTWARTTGTGISYAVAKIASVISPFVVSFTLTRMGYTSVFIVIAILYLLSEVILLVWGVDTTNKTLEEITENLPASVAAEGSV